jgi:ribokinase
VSGSGQAVAVAVVGSANLDLVVTADRRPEPGETLIGHSYTEAPGGKGANQALAAARVAVAHLIGHHGDDAAGRAVTRHLAGRGVGLSWFRPVGAPTGRALVFVTADAENSITVLPGANGELGAAHVVAGLTALRPGVVLAQCEIPMAAVAAAYEWCARNGARFVLNPSPLAAVPPEIVGGADLLILNAGEGRALAGLTSGPGHPAVPYAAASDARTLVRALLARTSRVVLTAGSDGAYIGEDGVVTHIPGRRVRVIDTTGAGDEFAGVLAGHVAHSQPLAAAVDAANDAAARVAALPRTAR